ncbi:MAG TPA: ATP-binding protein, partial [Candidatus Babeliaceae bacterium]|nr:ATP-binding protein [Candidatus Babeliaceae bacterium]
IYSKQNMPAKAIVYYKKAISLLNGKKNSPGHLHLISYYSLATAYYKTNDLANAKKILYPLVKRAQALSIDNELGKGFALLGNITLREGRYQEAAKWFNLYISNEGQILNKQNAEIINKLELKYRISEKDKEIAQKQLLLSKQEIELKNKDIWIGGVFAGVILLSMLALSFYRHNKHKQRIQAKEIQILKQEKEITKQEQQIELLKATMSGEEKERARLARELHDGIVGQLSAVKLNLSLIQKRYNVLIAAPDFQETISDLDEAAKDLRKTTHNLMPDLLLYNGLAGAADTYCEQISKTSTLQVYFHLSGYMPTLDPDFELSIYRIIQELVNNIVKHARATHALVQISFYEPSLLITIEDNGIGINKEEIAGKTGGIGLINVKDRTAALKGNFEISIGKDGGTVVNLEFDINYIKKQVVV